MSDADTPAAMPSPPALERLLGEGRVALFLDFDGTLVELAPTPDSIEVAPDLATRLGALARRLGGACAIVSGRGLDDIAGHLGTALPVAGAGSHGSDIRNAAGQPVGPAPSPVPPEIAQAMREHAAREGLDYETKPHGAALHFRKNPAKGPAAIAFAHDLAARHGWAAQDGKAVVEVVAGHTGKGHAVRALMATEPFAGARPLFIGDDLTDENGFSAVAELGGAGVLVGDRTPSAAHFALPDVASVHRWLGL